MKKKSILLLFAALSLFVLCFSSVGIRIFFSKVFWDNALKSPEFLSRSGILDEYGLDFYKDELDDVSTEEQLQRIGQAKRDLFYLNILSHGLIMQEDRISADILRWKLERQLEGERFVYYDYPVNQMFGIQSALPVFMLEVHGIRTTEDAHDYIVRLKKFGDILNVVQYELQERERRGILLPSFLAEKVIAEIHGFLVPDIQKNILYIDFVSKVSKGKIQGIGKMQEEVRSTLDAIIYPGYKNLVGLLQKLQKKSTTEAGVWKFPQGKEYYRYLVKFHTTTNMTPEEIHEIGLTEVDRIQTEIKSILVKHKKWRGDLKESLASLRKEKKFVYPENDIGRDLCLQDYLTIIHEMERGLPLMFHTLPGYPVQVKRIPEFREKTSPTAYYESPAMDGSRPGIFYANLRSMAEIPKFGMKTLAYHESIPGHHLQQSIQQDLVGIPIFRKFISFTAYVEGWALYAERLAWEYGYEKNDFENLGRLQAELFRAVRLVVDTGIHSKKWSREKAIHYMRNASGLAEKETTAEVDRYIVMPGQALAYKTGMIALLKIRESYKKKHKEAYSIKDFHELVLKNGAMPLAILEDVVMGL